MSDSPSIYLPRQLRPRRTALQNSEPTDVRKDEKFTILTTPLHVDKAALTTPNQQFPTESHFSKKFESQSNNNTLLINNNSDAYSAISISGQLGRQIRNFWMQRSALLNAEIAVGAFLLGYAESDGTIHLNRLDQGIQRNGKRIPTTAVCSDELVVPLFCGASKLSFYSCVLQHGSLYGVAGWITDDSSGAGLVVEFISTCVDMRVSTVVVPTVKIGTLSSLLASARQNDGATSRGSLCWNERKGYYEHFNYPIAPSEDVAWVASASDDQNAVARVYLEAGAPQSLVVVHINSAENNLSARMQQYRVEPIKNECTLHIQLGSVQFPESSIWSACTAKLLQPEQYDRGILKTLNAIAAKSKMTISLSSTEKEILSSPKQYVSPFIHKIVTVTRENTGNTPSNNRGNSSDSNRLVINGKANNGKLQDTLEPSQMTELLREQRNIRELLQEQNSLMRTQVSQAQELMRLIKHQPSPQTVTRRYLRMRGTHTPSLADTQKPGTIRRSNSLSEIVDGIRSFEVEGYEEMEHHTGYSHRRPVSFLSPVCVDNSNNPTTQVLEVLTTTASSASLGGSVSATTSSGISNLVSRINNIVNNNSKTAAPTSKPASFSRPPIPAYHRTQNQIASTASNGAVIVQNSYKITPTTQKYLDSLERQNPLTRNYQRHPSEE
ncbi:hypothetical protein GGI25_003451 [Coemansia spiralis]|uniref:Uncharacterized protein n=1 Tax=Coemansia spiralis TaxID=417178 RepID=A0A9W8G8H4_9FUNG|nr:hypothetical protein BX070DRAFT_157336 [Coemansia spiralis]KAJ2676699.1 hypothetical protein GGI25_003451 [Coemansia spiralis]